MVRRVSREPDFGHGVRQGSTTAQTTSRSRSRGPTASPPDADVLWPPWRKSFESILGRIPRRSPLRRFAGGSATPLGAVATGPFVGEGFDCPVLDTLFLAAPIAFKGRLVQYGGRILRAHPGKTTAEVHDYHDVNTGVLASSLAQRAPGYVSLGFPDPRRSASTR